MAILYISLIRKTNPDRKNFNTTLSKELLDRIKEIAKEREYSDNVLTERKEFPYNYLLEEGMEWVMENYYLKGSFPLPPKPKDRIRINTTFSARLFNQLKSRSKRLGKNIYANDLIEEGMKYIIDKYEKDKQ